MKIAFDLLVILIKLAFAILFAPLLMMVGWSPLDHRFAPPD